MTVAAACDASVRRQALALRWWRGLRPSGAWNRRAVLLH
ncbi:hypothetical protein BURMUCF2_0627 [Burkholderia multivorans CF2]|nr:hypothetical protein BURMUCF2_0627 [Burkholderia multivorans CF2]